MAEITVPIWRVADSPLPQADLPGYATVGSAGCDLAAAIPEPLVLPPGGRAMVRTGFAIALPAGYEGQVRPRSGLAAREGVTVINAPGTIDSDYRGEISVALVNLAGQPRTIEPGQRIAQLVVAPVTRVCWAECSADDAKDALATGRGTGGFGHTGKGSRQDSQRGSPDDERGNSR